jgi:Tol biopolymer transport system component/predicted Ser/Thr protein kinase
VPILPGKRLGPYEILSAVGAGGMGEVYRAKDTRLDRIVAIKILPDHHASNPELRERFEREARAVAALNHPNICTLHDVGHQDGIDYLVMEYVEGETLAARLEKGPLPLDQVLRYAIEIADALDKAHRKGVTHRDLKPGNIMLTKSGSKLLDFGLAKLREDAAPATPLSQLPTGKDPITAQGTILGTLQYMAPEQLEGKEADARTDIFAFGVVVYEMATGKKAFEGKSQASLIAAILEREPPPMSSLQPMTPPALDRVVRTCLAKDPDDRWQTAADVTKQLKWIAEGGSQAGILMPVATHRKTREGLMAAVAAIAVVTALALAFLYFRRVPQDARTTRFFVSPPETWGLAQQLVSTGTGAPPAPLAVSPDGHQIAFAATSADGKTLLWVRSLDTIAAQALAGTEGAVRPFWSPDSRFLGFFADGKLKKIEVSGGPPITLCDSSGGGGGAWSRDGVIVFSSRPYSGLQKVSASGGVPTPATKLSQGDIAHVRPSFLPDGRHFLYRGLGSGVVVAGAIYLSSLDSADQKLLFNADSTNVLYSQGYLLFLRETTLMAQPFDARRFVLTGEAFPIAEQIRTQGALPYGFFSASENGVLAYQTGSGAAGSQLVWFDRAGKQIRVLGDPALYTDLELSPDGKRASISFPAQASIWDIWIYDLARGLPTRFTFGTAQALTSIWSPDGSRIVFNSREKRHFDLYQKASSGAGTEEVLLEDNLDKYPVSWSPDGRFILYRTTNAAASGLFVFPLSGDRKPYPFLKTQFNEGLGQFSPDGRWVAYESNDSARDEIYVAPFPGPGGKWQISTAGGSFPRWRRDGTEIFYLAPDNKLMAAAVNGKGGSFEVGVVKPLFETNTFRARYSFAVSPDGQRFLMINTTKQQVSSAPITVVLNWTAGLKK